MYAIPVVRGVKSREETFAGADFSTTVELFVPSNGRGIQGATSHYLGQNFSKMFEIWFENDKKQKEFAYQTSWGYSTRSIGSMIMIHGDNKGLVLPPRVAQVQVVIVPITSKDNNEAIEEACRAVLKRLKDVGVRARFDDRTIYKPGWKFNHWEVKGVPIRIEVGKNDIEKKEVKIVRRFDGHKQQISLDNLETFITEELENIHTLMYQKALTERDSRIVKAGDWETFMFNLNHSNLLLTPWCDQQSCEKKVKDRSKEESKTTENEAETSLTGSAKTLCKPLKQDLIEPGTKCFHCGADAVVHALWGRSY